MARLEKCPCGSGEYPEQLYDGHGIFMCYVCSKCRKKKVAGYRPDIFEAYDTDEQIEDDY